MPERPPLNEWIDYAYAKQGGWKVATEIFGGPLKFEQKLDEARKVFGVSMGTAGRWYTFYNRNVK